MTTFMRRRAMRLIAGAPAMVFDRGTARALSFTSPAVANWVNEIVVVCVTHLDIGYTDDVAEFITYYRITMVDRVLNLIDQSNALPPSEHVIWTSPGWTFEQIVEEWSGQTVDRRQRRCCL